ncbi:hypothetical protein QL285_084704 [Trifolium repens]|nr:hypothetical protein QL285_084704 [Trifolium repens]
MVRVSCIRRIHTHAALTIYHLSITNTSREYDKTTNSVNTECLHTPPFRACQDKTPDQEKHHLSPPSPPPPLPGHHPTQNTPLLHLITSIHHHLNITSCTESIAAPHSAGTTTNRKEKKTAKPSPLRIQICHHRQNKTRSDTTTETAAVPAPPPNREHPKPVKTPKQRRHRLCRNRQQNHRKEKTNPQIDRIPPPEEATEPPWSKNKPTREETLTAAAILPERTGGAVVRRTTVTRRTTYGRDLHREAWIWIKGGGGGEKISFYAEREKGAFLDQGSKSP